MSRVHIVRHGRTAHNVARRIQGPLIDDGLDEVGKAQAEALARRFSSLREHEWFSGVYSSPLRRAVETAEPLARALDLPVVTVPGFTEFSWGDVMGRVEEGEVEAFTREAIRRWTAGEVRFAPPGGESPASAGARVLAAFHDVERARARGSVVLVAHGRINKILLALLVHADAACMEEFPQWNAAVTVLSRAADGPWRVVVRNDRSHHPVMAFAQGPRAGPRDEASTIAHGTGVPATEVGDPSQGRDSGATAEGLTHGFGRFPTD